MEIEKSLLKKGHLPTEYVGVPLPTINVSWRQIKQGKGKNKAKKDLSLNKLSAFQENRCLVCTVKALKGSWPRLAPLWEAFHKMGLNRQALGWSCLMVDLYNGQATDSDQVTMQHPRRVNIIYTYKISHAILLNICRVHKRVEIKMDDGSKPMHKFANLCRGVMWLKSTSTNGMLKPLFDAIIPVGAGPQLGNAIITYQTDNAEAPSLICKMHSCVAKVQAQNGAKAHGEFCRGRSTLGLFLQV
jgi:hypothetical protein